MRFSPVWSPVSYGDGFAHIAQGEVALSAESFASPAAVSREDGLGGIQSQVWPGDDGNPGSAVGLAASPEEGGGFLAVVYPSGSTITTALLYPSYYWLDGNFTFSIPTAGSTWPGYPASSEPDETEYGVLSAAQAVRFRAAITIFDDLIAPEFTEVTEPASVGHIRVAFTDVDTLSGSDVWGYAYTPQEPPFAPSARNGDIWIGPERTTSTFASGSFDWMALLHEIGHAVGLKHSFEGGATLPTEFDTRRYTVMSYTNMADGVYRTFTPTGGGGLSATGTTVSAATPMVFDILAIQTRYGADTGTRTGDTTYTWSETTPLLEAVYDAGGIDTFDLSAHTRGSIIDLTPGAYSSIAKWSVADQITYYKSLYSPGAASFITTFLDKPDTYTWTDNIGIAFSTTIENVLCGSGNDTILGNTAANTLNGGAGNDWIDGGAGDDFLVGGAGGVNTLIGGAGTDLISFSGTSTPLYVDLSAGAYAYAGGGWDALTSIEGVLGGSGADTLFGDAGANLLRGGAGNDTLVGHAGSDTLVGEAGDDWIVGETGDDTLEGGAGINVLLGGAGTDLASYASQTAGLWIDMPAGVYSAAGVWDVFFDSIDGVLGGSGNDSIFGNSSDNMLKGADGDDALIGASGNDTLMGGAGLDWIVGGDGNDRLIGGTSDVDVLTGGAGNDIFDLGTACGWDVAFDFSTSLDSFYLGGLSWLGFLTFDADGDGSADDTLLGYAGGNFVALNVSGLTLAAWNALVTAGPLSAGDVDAEKITADPNPQVRPVLPDDHSGDLSADGFGRSQLLTLAGQFGLGPDPGFGTFVPRHPSIYDIAPPDWTPLMA